MMTAVLLLLLAIAIAIIVLASRRRRETFEVAATSDVVGSWEPIDAGEDMRPLLLLGVQRVAASRSSGDGLVLAGPHVRVRQAWQERVRGGREGGREGDRWHRWLATACFFRQDDAFGACETLDLRARTAWGSSRTPTEWPVELGPGGGPVGGPPVPTSQVLGLAPPGPKLV
jgi:hypothetical protein